VTAIQTFRLPGMVSGTESDPRLGHDLVRAWQADGIFQVATDPAQDRVVRDAMEASKRFFQLPMEVKARHVSDLTYSGYIASGEEVTANEVETSTSPTSTPPSTPRRPSQQRLHPLRHPFRQTQDHEERRPMPIPIAVARVNRVLTNRVTKLFAGWMPGFGMILHQGRRSGRSYQTPVNVFRQPDGYVVALTYGPDTDWVKNVVAAGGCVLRTRRRQVRLVDPRIVHDPTRHDLPPVVRLSLGRVGITDLLYLAIADGNQGPR
jgi:deazaflavin-dependent oxidoreductase (nitroreductase family)